MAITRTARLTATSKTSGTTLSLASQTVSAKSLLVVYLAYDDATLDSVTFAGTPLTLGDPVLGAGVRTRLAWLYVANATTGVVTATWASAITAKAMVADSFVSSQTTWVPFDDANNTNTGTGAAASTAATSAIVGGTESIRVGVVGTEGPSGDTAGTWVEPNTNGQRVGTTGNPAAGNVTVSSAYRLAPTAGSTTGLSKTGMTSRDWGAAIRSFYWGLPVTVVSGSFTANAILKGTVSTSATADAVLKSTVAGSLTANSVLILVVGVTFTADAILKTNAPVWISPADTSTVSDLTPTLEFDMSIIATGAMFFEIQMDTANTFDTVNLRVYRSHADQTGWEYWDGAAWQPVPSSGVPSSMVGNSARFTIPTNLTQGVWYRRIKGGS